MNLTNKSEFQRVNVKNMLNNKCFLIKINLFLHEC